MNWSLQTILGGTAMLTVASLILTRIKTISQTVMRMLGLVQVKVYGQTATDLSMLLNRTFTKSPFGLRTYSSTRLYVKPAGRYQNVAYEQLSNAPTIFWRGWRPLLVTLNVNPSQNATDYNNTTLTFFRGTYDPDTLMLEAVDMGNNFRAGKSDAGIRHRFRIERYIGLNKSAGAALNQLRGPDRSNSIESDSSELMDVMSGRILRWKPDDLGDDSGRSEQYSALDLVALPPAGLEFVEEFEHWLASEQWYKQRNLVWKRGWLFTGPPGTGKSALVRAVALDYDVPIAIFDLGSMSNSELREAWSSFLSMTPAIALFEDIDRVFNGSENIVKGTADLVTFDCLLNVLSGIEPNSGVFVIITTNHPETLDPALGVPRVGVTDPNAISTRPGRIDRVLQLGALDEAGRLQLASRILSDCPELIASTIEAGAGDTGAQFVERCGRIADNWHWSQEKSKVAVRGLHPPRTESRGSKLSLPMARKKSTARSSRTADESRG